MRLLQVGTSLDVASGGTASTCAHLSNHLARRGVETAVLTDRQPATEHEWRLDDAVLRRQCGPVWPKALGYAPDCGRVLAAMPPPDVVHVHGLWRLHFQQAAWYARRVGAPVVITLHGMLHAQHLRQRQNAKRAARWIYQDRMVRGAACLHATAEHEVDDVRREGFDRPVAVIPWGVDWPTDAPARSARPRTIVYLGRLHPSKRLDTLLCAWARIRPHAPGWSVVLIGPGEPHDQAELARIATDLGIAASVRFAGPQHGEPLERLLAGAAVLVQPSPAENFSLVVAEALARGVPVIATHGAPWGAIAAERCGWWVPAGVDGLASALCDACAAGDATLQAMGERGRRFARERFDWPTVTASMIELYTWLLGRGPEPPFVRH